MRETIVRELFANDFGDLAWQAATAPRVTIDEISDRELCATRRGAPVKGRLMRAALEELSGRSFPTLPARSRSPILEMPPELRNLATRNAARDELTRNLAFARRSRTAWGGVRLKVTGGTHDAHLSIDSGLTG